MSAPAGGGGAASAAPAYALYRATGLGRSFVESLGEMFHAKELSNDQVIQALLCFDRTFTAALADRAPPNRVNMEAKLQSYRFCDGVWTLQLKDAKFEGAEGTLYTPNIKVVACEAKGKGKRVRR